MSDTTFVEVENSIPARRWLYRLSTPIRFSNHIDRAYSEGERTTEYVVVSWGRDGDTCIFPANEKGGIEDMEGFNGRDGWDEPRERLQEWLDGAVYGLGSGESFEAVKVEYPWS